MSHALRVLEFQAIRDRLRYFCEMPLAELWANELNPSFDEREVWERIELTSEAYDALGKHSPPALGAIGDPREALQLAAKGATLGGADLFRIGDGLSVMRSLRGFLEARTADLPRLATFAISLPDLKRLEDQLLESFEPDGAVRDEASMALSTIRARKKSATARIQERIQSYLSGKTRELLSDPIYTVRDGRYVLPLKAENRGKLRGIVHDTSASGQTIYVEPEEILQLGNALREVEAAERTEVQRLLGVWSGRVGAAAEEILTGIHAAASIDFALAKARLGYDQKGTLPETTKTPHTIEVQGGRHPLLENVEVVPLDLTVGIGRSLLITGPNTGGKTVAIKSVGLFVLMAQSGLMVPARYVRLSPFTQVWADIGDEQSLQQSLSTFSGHLKNIAEALKLLKPGALVLLDEVGAGTDPAEGAALAKAILGALAEGGATVLASTHYGELKAFAFSQKGFVNAAMEFNQKTLQPTYRLLMGSPGASQALRIAERYGIPKPIIETAREGLGAEVEDMATMMEQLETSQRQARLAQGEADRRLAELRKSEQKAARKLAEAEEIRQKAHGRANEIIEAALREIRLEAARIFDDIKLAGADSQKLDRGRQELRDLDRIGREFAAEFLPRRRTTEIPELHKGQLVKVEGLTQVGTVLAEPKDGQVALQMGMLKMSVPLERIEQVDSKVQHQEAPKSNLRLQKALTANTEIDLRHLRAEEAMRDLERFVDDAVLAGLDNVRIVHGKGEGILRKATQEFLRRHHSVSGYRDGDATEGGHGVTIAVLA